MKLQNLVLIIVLLTSSIDEAQIDKIWTQTERLNPNEAQLFDAANVLKPTVVRRFYRMTNAKPENFRNEAIYTVKDGLINGEYVYYKTFFSGDGSDFSLTFEFSLGRAMTWHGTFLVIGGEQLLTEYYYGTGASTVKLTRNGKVIYEKTEEF
jgi:hypothetical protein